LRWLIIITTPIAMDPMSARKAATATIGRSRWVIATVTEPVPLMIGIIIMLAPAIAGAACPREGGGEISNDCRATVGGSIRAGRLTIVVVICAFVPSWSVRQRYARPRRERCKRDPLTEELGEVAGADGVQPGDGRDR
ncbi:MAG: hypothetical protein ABWY50_04075, partial [Aeromicrobium sp.]